MKLKSAVLGLVAIGLIVVLAACAGADQSDGDSANLAVTATDFQFTPNQWTVPAGGSVALTLTNNGTEVHEWVLLNQGTEVTMPFDADDEDKVFWEIEAEPGATNTGTFTAPAAPGQYTVVCGTAGHLEAGMQGTLTVE